MTLFRRRISSLLLAGGVATGACSSNVASGELQVAAYTSSTLATPSRPITLRVTARNVGSANVTWGSGSSTCQFALLVRVDGEDLDAPVNRVCTMDLRTLSLGPGESRTEIMEWTGLVHRVREAPAVLLAPGTYELRAAAGRAAVSEPVLVEVRP